MADQSNLNRFHSAASHYLAGRPAYSERLIRRVVDLTGIGRDSRIMDLGCGPGQLARAFAPHVAEVIAIDPEPAMIAAGAAEALRPANVTFLEGHSAALPPGIGQFSLVAIGRAFHWMDRADTLARLDPLLLPGGALALLGDRHPDVPDNEWVEEFRALRSSYARLSGAAPGFWKGKGWPTHEAILLEGPFAQLERISVLERRRCPAALLADRALSMSSTSPSRLGSAAEALCRDIEQLAARFESDGQLAEVVETVALLAWRTGEGPL